jgi:hypothetical protein
MILLRLYLTRSRISPTEQTEIRETPDDIAEKLSLLAFEMADPEQDLSVQQPSYGATTFTCIPKLALELRLMIWRAAFPRGRKLEVEAQRRWYNYYGPPLPSTLMINQESRKETLRHYLVYYQNDELLKRVPATARKLRSTRNVQKGPRPICYNPDRDLLFVPTWRLADISDTALLNIIAEKCKPLGNVRILALDEFDCIYSWETSKPNRLLSVITSLRDYEEIWCVHGPKNFEEHKTKGKEMLYKAFDLEREKSPCINYPKILFFDSMHDLEKSMRSQGW